MLTQLKRCIGGAFAIMLGALCHAQPATAQELCGSYTIVSGDTLSALSQRIYGDNQAFMRFYDDPRNVDSLGSNPNRISIGDILFLQPCPGSETNAGVSGPNRDVDQFSRQIDIVTGTDFAPFTDQTLPDGGMLTRVVREAFEYTNLENPVETDFINDWSSHLTVLLPKGKYTFGFPWYKPDCKNPAKLSENMQVRCGLLWSDSLFSVVIGFYAPAGLANPPQDFSDLEGKRLCRPSGYFTFDLEQEGLVPGETIGLMQPVTVGECFSALEDGDVDFVSINRFTAEKAIARAGLTGLVEPLQTIVSTQSLHLVAHPHDGDAANWLNAFNKGLKELKDSGRYSRLTRQFLQIHEEETRKLAGN